MTAHSPNQKLRVLHIIDTVGVGGGAESNFAAVVPLMTEFEQRVVHFRPEDGYAPGLRASGVEVVRLPLDGPLDYPAMFRSLRRFVDEADVVHTQTLMSDLWGRLVALSRRPIVTTVQIPAYESQIIAKYSAPGKVKNLGLWAADTLLSRRARHMVCVSGYVRQTVLDNLRVEPKRASVIYNAVAVDDLRPLAGADRARARSELGLPADAFLIVSVGKLSWIKGQEILLEAMPEILRAVPRATLVLIGTGERRSALEARAAALGISDKVRFLGLRSDVAHVLSVCDLFSLASRTEGLSLAVAEAMATSLPVVLSDIPPHLEMQERVKEFEATASASMIAQRTENAFAQKVIRLATDSALLRDLGSGCRRAAEKYFNAAGAAKALARILTEAARS